MSTENIFPHLISCEQLAFVMVPANCPTPPPTTTTPEGVLASVILYGLTECFLGFPDGSVVKNLPAIQEIQVQSLGWEDPLENETAAHSSMLAWRI